jgi:tetratricopeptide (TPR) repeat protein
MDMLRALTKLHPSRIVFLCGAGVSYDSPTKLPTVNSFVYEVLKECGAARHIIATVRRQIETESVVSRFEVLIDEIRKLHDPELKVGSVFDSRSFNENHYFLAQMLLKGAAVLTTNFDNCIENALGGITVPRIVFANEDLSARPPLTGVLVKVHGSNPLKPTRSRPTLLISIKSLAATAQGFTRLPKWRSYLVSLLRDKVLVVVGYSGSDDFDVMPLIAKSRPEHVMWLDFQRDQATPRRVRSISNRNVRRLAKSLRLTYYRGRLDSFVESCADRIGFPLRRSRGGKHALKIGRYVATLYPSISRKEELINTILLNYSLYDAVIARELRSSSAEIVIQKMKALYRTGRASNVRELFKENQGRFKSESQRSQALYFQSAALYQMSEFRKAIAVARKQLTLSKRQGDGVALIHALNNLGSMYYAVGEYGKSKVCYEEALMRLESDASFEGQATAWWGLGINAQALGNHAEGYEYYKKAYQIYTELGNKFSLVYTTLNLGVALIELSRYGMAERYLKEAEAGFRSPYNPQGLIFVLNSLAKLYRRLGRLNRSVTVISEAMEIIERYPGLPIASEVALIYMSVSLQKGYGAEALERHGRLVWEISRSRGDVEARLLQQVLRKGEKALPRVEKYLYGKLL